MSEPAHGPSYAELREKLLAAEASIEARRIIHDDAMKGWRQTLDQLAAERAAHEATKAARAVETEALEADLEGAEKRVTELERKLAEKAGYDAWMRTAKALGAELDQARGFAKRALAYLTDEQDVESTPMHAIGHARTELRGLLAAVPPTADPPAAPDTFGDIRRDWWKERET